MLTLLYLQCGINLEHILPQSPSAEWDIDSDTLKANYRRLGNMVLLRASENELIGNEGCDKKRPVLAMSDFSLARQAAAYSMWTPEQITDRQAKLAALAIETWPLKP